VEKTAVCAEIHGQIPISPWMISSLFYFTALPLWLQWLIFEMVDGRFLTEVTVKISKSVY
jgi:hypothetical protein